MTQSFVAPSGTTEGGRLRADRRASRRAAEARALGAGVAALGLLVLASCGTADDDRGDSAALAGSPTESSPTASASPDPNAVDIDPEGPAGEATPAGGKPWDADVSTACADALAADGRTGLTEVAQTADADGVTSFWAAGRTWVACDALAGADAPEPELFVPQPGAGSGFDEEDLSVSATVVDGADGGVAAVRYAAAGELPWPVQEMSYTFPDGHTERARFVSGVSGSGAESRTWWAVAYTATEGPLVDPDTDSADLDPMTISIVGAAAEAFRLPWEDAQRPD